jgi:hypothetical protein
MHNPLLPTWAGSFGEVSLAVKKTNSNDSDKSVADTVALMGTHSNNASPSQQVRAALQAAGVIQGGLTEDQVIQRVFNWIHGNIQFVEDEEQLRKIFYDPKGKELLITPPVLLSMSRPMGDCDDFSMLACSMLMAKGIQCDFVTVAANGNAPLEFSHVYCMARTRDGRVIPFDASHGKEAGWETARAYRKQVWPVFNWGGGERRNGMGGMGMIANDSFGQMKHSLGLIDGSRYAFDQMFEKGLKGLVGLGDNCTYDDQGNVISCDYPTGSPDIMTGVSAPSVNLPSSSNPTSVSSPPASTGGVNWNSILQSITGAVSKIAVQSTQPAGVQQTVCNAQGVCTSNSTVLPANYTGSLSLPGLNTSSLGSLLPLLLIGAVVIFAMDQK